jgi:hypothetical protein
VCVRACGARLAACGGAYRLVLERRREQEPNQILKRAVVRAARTDR